MEPFLGQLSLFAFNVVPTGWMRCEGQILQIQQNPALYSLLGTQFGGNGTTTFGLPDLQGRVPQGGASVDKGGLETVSLAISQIPAHNHSIRATTSAANNGMPGGALLADPGAQGPQMYAPQIGASPATLATAAVATAGGGQAHENRQPFLALAWCIAITGVYPSRG